MTGTDKGNEADSAAVTGAVPGPDRADQADRADRDLDIVLFGASGFVGRLVAAYLAGHAPDGVRIGLAGRSVDRLARVRDELGPPATGWPLLTADTGDEASVARLARSTRVLATTVGPYARYGTPVVRAAAAAGTDYVDLTGEVLFVRDSATACHDLAGHTGARIIHSCGYDSVPSDLGVLLLHQRAQADGAGTLGPTTLVASARGGFSGGTVDSLRAQVEAVTADPGLRRVLADPYALSPQRDAEPDLGAQPDLAPVHHDAVRNRWVGPFVMAPYNTRVVRRSNALLDWAYGRRFRYREGMSFGTGPAGPAVASIVDIGLRLVPAAFAFAPARTVLDSLLPAPGEGPDAHTRDSGFFHSDLRTVTSRGAGYHAVVAGQGDPGYAATSIMLSEAALCLVLNRDALPDRTGVLTPATGLGTVLVERLRAAGMTLTVGRTSTL